MPDFFYCDNPAELDKLLEEMIAECEAFEARIQLIHEMPEPGETIH